jgi:glycosyltransferase involved in cell wall biosynthesis
MRFNFYSHPTFEPWDWTNPDRVGIGGSETSHIEMCRRISLRGHEVNSFAPLPNPSTAWVDDVCWNPSAAAPFAEQWSGVWVIYRQPSVIDQIPDDRTIWLVCQDVDYTRPENNLMPERCAKLTRIIALCETHGQYLRNRYPYAADKIFVSSNGIKGELIEKILENPPERNPRRLIYASSPDRGMEYLLSIFPRAKEIVPDLELHVFYGFDNIDKVVQHYGEDSRVGVNTARLKALLNQPGVTHHGRTGQPELLKEWFKSGIWCHPSNFTETSCITCMDAQACGAIPITCPTWAVSENVKHGVFIDGNLKNEVVRSRYVLELIRMAVDPSRQSLIRCAMMPWALEAFGWELFVDQWIGWARHDMKVEIAA